VIRVVVAICLACVPSSAFAQATATAPAPAQPAPAQTITPAPPQIAFPGQYAPTPADWKFPVWPKGCTRFQGEERVACLEFNAYDYGRLARFSDANIALASAPARGRVVFFGDSITDNWSRAISGGFFPGKPYVNRGIGGQTTGQMLVRFRADVIDLHPAAVVILAGTNDLAGNAGPVSPDQVVANLTTMTELAKLHGIRVILASILPVSDDKKDASGAPLIRSLSKPVELLRSVNSRLAQVAAESGQTFLNYFSAMADAGGHLRPELNDDGLHPNAQGYAVMTPLAEQAIAHALP
jgi:lysophospholipase L1-like esterase